MASSSVEALLLAAGRGERLRPLTDVVPKAGMPLPGAPLGAWMLEALLARFTSVVVNASHLAALLISQLGLEDRTEVMVEEPEPYGTGGTLSFLRDRVEDRIVVANADVISDVDVGALIRRHDSAGAPATVAVTPVAAGADFELRDGMVSRFIDRRGRGDGSGARFIGVSIWDRKALERPPEGGPVGLGEALLAPLASRGELAAYVHDGHAADVGTPARYARACHDVLREVGPPPPEGPYERFHGHVLNVGGGRAFIARDAACEEQSLGDGAILLAGARVLPGAMVTRAIVWPGETVPAGVDLRDAVWFRGTSLSLK